MKFVLEWERRADEGEGVFNVWGAPLLLSLLLLLLRHCNREMTAFHFDRALASSRSSSEDRAEVIAIGDETLVVIADGAGGLSGGGDASDLFVDAIRGAVSRSEDDLVAIFGAVDRVLASQDGGETTAIVVVVRPNGIFGVSVGDSEAWVVTANAVDDLTASQSRNRLGSGRAEPVAFARASLDGTLVVGTDGLFKYAAIDAIAKVARAGGDAVALVDLVRLRSGALPDDVAVVVARRATPEREPGDPG